MTMRAVAYSLILAVIGMASTFGSAQAAGAAWDVLLIPASLNADRTVKVLGGYVQDLEVMLQASDEVRALGNVHAVTLEISLPPGTVIEDYGDTNFFSVLRAETGRDERGRTVATFTFMLRNDNLAGRPGETAVSEWHSFTVFARFPEALENAADAYVGVTLDHRRIERGEIVSTRFERTWPLELYRIEEPAVRLERTWVGLWDYSLSRASKGAGGVAEWLAASGVNFIETGRGEFHEAMRARGIVTGGYVHHGNFYIPQCPDMYADGRVRAGDYPDPQCVINMPEGTEIPGVAQLVETATTLDGWATIDFEPMVPTGFTKAALEAFERFAGVDAETVERFRQGVAESGVFAYQSTDPTVASLYDKWLAFHTGQVSAYIERLAREMKRIAPDSKFAVTPNDGFAYDDITARGFGYVAAELARHVDAIMPQIYIGYGGTAVKLVLQRVEGWRDALAERGAEAKLVPILLVRYAGATVYNTPARVRQQIFASLAGGADGFLLYYPGNMDASYWRMLNDTTREIAAVEAFYHDGERVDDVFTPVGMPDGYGEFLQYPGHTLTARDPDWAYTAHRYDGKYLLTLFNLKSEGALTFRFDSAQEWEVVSAHGAAPAESGGWIVPAEDVAWVILAPRP